jgi:hypothetical protein
VKGERMPENNNISSTPYDDVFHTLVVDCTDLMIPVVNEAFNEDYTKNARIVLKQNEVYQRQQNGNTVKKITDSNLEIIENEESADYHVECESTYDGTIIIRIYEYDSQIALYNGEFKDGVLEVKFPHAGILFLRSNSNTPDKYTIKITTPAGSLPYDVQVLKVKSYTLAEIFEKKLLLLIPFYIFNYEDGLKGIEDDEEKLKALKSTYADIRKTLDDMCLSGEIDEYTKCSICEMSERVINSLAFKHEKIKKEVTEVMGGQVLEYEAKNILNRGLRLGREEGRVEGRMEGRMEGIPNGENKLARLIKSLRADNRQDEVDKVLDDEAARQAMYKEYGITD